MQSTPIFSDVAIAALRVGADELRAAVHRYDHDVKLLSQVERLNLAIAVLETLADNVNIGASELWRTSMCTVVIRTAAIEPVNGSGPIVAHAQLLDD